MRSRMVVRLVMLSTILALPMVAHAQDASVSGMVTGTVTCSSGAMLRGATVRAVHESTGNTFDDNKGAMR